MASQPKNTLPIAAVFSNLFRNIPRLVLLNLIFAVPLGAVFSLLWLLVSALDPEYNIRLLMMLLTVPLSYPFFSGIVRITSKMSAGEEKVEIFRNYFHTYQTGFAKRGVFRTSAHQHNRDGLLLLYVFLHSASYRHL